MKVVFTDAHEQHDTTRVFYHNDGAPCGEVPKRIDEIKAACHDCGVSTFDAVMDHGTAPILAIHDPKYVTFLERIHAAYVQRSPASEYFFADYYAIPTLRNFPPGTYEQHGAFMADGFTAIGPGTWHAAYWSAQNALTACDLVASGSTTVAYALCRPPGHHAGRASCGGFCYLNNAAIAAKFLANTAMKKPQKVAILDVDFHHGNGTQDIFYRDGSVFAVSIHGDPDSFYPHYVGAATERGEGAGERMILNLPLPRGTDDARYLKTLAQALDEIAKYGATALVVSLGYDIRVGDPYGGFAVTPEGFRAIGSALNDFGLPTVVLQEGGYLLEHLRGDARSFVNGLLET